MDSFEQVCLFRLANHFSPSFLSIISCRLREGPFPWTCEHEKHNYEVCQYEVYQYRMALKEHLVATGKWNKGQFPESNAVKY
jgi:hypothetical protein